MAAHRVKRPKPFSIASTAGAAGLAIAAFATVAYTGAGQPQAEEAAAVSPMAATAAPAASIAALPTTLPEAFKAPEIQKPAPQAEQPAPAPAPAAAPAAAPAPVYSNDLDGWIRQAMDILNAHNIPASYDGIMRNIMRESTGNPQAINLYDSNAAAGIPSKGLLQVIDPTFQAYRLDGTSSDIWDPVANIVAACNYAAHRYGSMDNVNSAY